MRIKKLLALAVCVVIAVCSLVGCETAIGEYLEIYEQAGIGAKPEKEKVTIDLYIITELPENYEDEAVASEHRADLATVKQNINLHLEENYRTTLNITFCSAEEYDDLIKSKTSGIVLINSEQLMNELLAKNALADLTNYLASDEYEFGTLNVQIAATLLDAAAVDGKLFCIPNNHVVGSYDYIAVNKDIAAKLHYGKNDIAKINTPEAAQQFVQEAEKQWSNPNLGMEGEFSADLLVRTFENVGYGYVDASAPANAWEYNVAEYPVVDKAEAYSTAFGILASTPNPDRAMEIIYALNTDIEFRNLLQYGVLNNDYEIIHNDNSDAVNILIKDTTYKMNILYTGDIFKAYYVSPLWTEDMAIAGKQQNADSLLAD